MGGWCGDGGGRNGERTSTYHLLVTRARGDFRIASPNQVHLLVDVRGGKLLGGRDTCRVWASVHETCAAAWVGGCMAAFHTHTYLDQFLADLARPPNDKGGVAFLLERFGHAWCGVVLCLGVRVCRVSWGRKATAFAKRRKTAIVNGPRGRSAPHSFDAATLCACTRIARTRRGWVHGKGLSLAAKKSVVGEMMLMARDRPPAAGTNLLATTEHFPFVPFSSFFPSCGMPSLSCPCSWFFWWLLWLLGVFWSSLAH